MGTKEVAGVVHGQEYVFDASATRRIGVANLEAMRRGSALLGSVSQAAASMPSTVGAGREPFTYSPTIHAPGADMGAVRRIEQALDNQARNLKGNVTGIMARQARFKRGSRKP
jgi:phage-related minor tail protein